MSKVKVIFIIVAAIIIGAEAVIYGATTAPQKAAPQSSPAAIPKVDLNEKLKTEESTIVSVLTANYPKITIDYIVNPGKLYDQGEWYGTTLTYKGNDSMNRDTLRVLMQKKQGIWSIRTTPPQPLLSTVEFPDVPKSVLQSINKPISLPGSDSSPAINAGG